MFAWILKTKPLNSSRAGSMGPASDGRARGGGMSSEKVSRKASRPKLFTADPKNMGESWPASKRSWSKTSPAISSSSASWRRLVVPGVVELLAQRRVVDAGDLHRRALGAGAGAGVGPAGLEQVHPLAQPVVDAPEDAAAEDGPGDRVDADAEHVLHLADEVEGVAPRTVELVHEGEDGDGPLPADPEELAGLGLHALGAVEEHDRAVHRVERPVGVLAEVGVARGVEQVHLQPPVGELQDAGGDGDPALPLHLHPVGDGAGPPPLGLHRPGQLDDAAVEQELLGERRLAGVRVGDDGEGAPACDLVLHGVRPSGRTLPITPSRPAPRRAAARAAFPFQNWRGAMASAISRSWLSDEHRTAPRRPCP